MRDVIDFANNKLVICCPFTWKPYVPIYFLTKFQTKFNGMANRIFLHSKCNMPLKRYWRGRSRKVKCYDIYEKLIAAGGNVLCACNEINNNLKEQSWREKWLEYDGRRVGCRSVKCCGEKTTAEGRFQSPKSRDRQLWSLSVENTSPPTRLHPFTSVHTPLWQKINEKIFSIFHKCKRKMDHFE